MNTYTEFTQTKDMVKKIEKGITLFLNPAQSSRGTTSILSKVKDQMLVATSRSTKAKEYLEQFVVNALEDIYAGNIPPEQMPDYAVVVNTFGKHQKGKYFDDAVDALGNRDCEPIVAQNYNAALKALYPKAFS